MRRPGRKWVRLHYVERWYRRDIVHCMVSYGGTVLSKVMATGRMTVHFSSYDRSYALVKYAQLLSNTQYDDYYDSITEASDAYI